MGSMYEGHIRNVAKNVRGVVVEGSGHWIPEEKPQDVIDELVKILPSPE
jgi:pimeloyl-ACP methyl ester carboxylesterase